MPVIAPPLAYDTTVPSWVQTRWTNTFSGQLEYEHMHEIVHTFLGLAFPPSDYFVIVPQGLLRNEASVSSESTERSYDAMDGSHAASRSDPGLEKGVWKPDFIIYKVFQGDTAPEEDIIIAIVAVKEELDYMAKGANQLFDYMGRVAERGKDDDMRRQDRPAPIGLFIQGVQTVHAQLSSHSKGADIDRASVEEFDAVGGTGVWNKLSAHARAWC
ncbi:hypothetical protein FPV67DRAFT_951132 [Lyophyllum atratum]|nr:hypothetical protein FPV67DRAFT_951132 [Lyophyllum atratum]